VSIKYPAMKNNRSGLGRLSSLGVSEPWQAPFYLPVSWLDYTSVIDSLDNLTLDWHGVFVGILTCDPDIRFRGVPRAVCRMRLKDSTFVGFTMFGDIRNLNLYKGKEVAVSGLLERFGEVFWINKATLVPQEWIGKLCPCYKGKPKVISADTVRTNILSLLDRNIESAAAFLYEKVLDNVTDTSTYIHPFESVEALLWEAHRPATLDSGKHAHDILDRAAAKYVARSLNETFSHQVCSPSLTLSKECLIQATKKRSKAIPFSLTSEQKEAVSEIIGDLSDKTMHRLLLGDVGSGKTAVYALTAAAVVDNDGRVIVLLPNKTLARQIHKEFETWWPDLRPQIILGDTASISDTRIIIGTTAVLSRPLPQADYVIVDEQHKFSRKQREQLVGDGIHLLEASATCIPRSQALLRYGAIAVSQLRECHVDKDIKTRVFEHEERVALFQGVKEAYHRGEKILVIYPRRGSTNEESESPTLKSAEDGFAQWNRLFPDMVALAHGGQDDKANNNAVQSLISGDKRILVSTTVVEVGITIPGLRYAVVVHAERFGLTSLHQIRGRLCRDGGVGHFCLYLPTTPGENSLERLKVLESSANGFDVAEKDMLQRGFGDLSANSDQQTGSGESFLPGRPVSMYYLDKEIQCFASIKQ